MRAIFNTTVAVYHGPGSDTPGVLITVVPCRFVEERRQTPITDPLVQRVGYVTMDEYVPNGPGVLGGPAVYVSAYGASDLLSIPAGNAKLYQVLFTELVVPLSGSPYARAHVRENPELGVLSQEDLYHVLQEDGHRLLVTD